MLTFLEKDKVLEKFILYVRKEGIEVVPGELKTSERLIDNYLKAYIIRNFFDNEGFYPVVNEIDNAVKKAIGVSGAKNNYLLSQIKTKTQMRRHRL